MTRSEKYLYHQIHPTKLLTDFGTSFASTWLVWERQWALAAFVALVPSIAISIVLMGYTELEGYKDTPLGRYVRSYMTPRIVGARLCGQLLMWGGAAGRIPWLVPFGLFVIVLAWLNGLMSPVKRTHIG
jgi:hypothetical protein